jgi:transposase, IS5 family
VQARAGAKHVKRRGYYFDPKSSGYPEAHCQTPMMAGRYAHAKQFKRHQRQLRLLRGSAASFATSAARSSASRSFKRRWPLTRARPIRSPQQRQRGWKLYSSMRPRSSASARAKPARRTSSASKASITTTNARAPAGVCVLHATAMPGNPYDGQTRRERARWSGRRKLIE